MCQETNILCSPGCKLSDHAHAAGHCVICHIQRLAKYAVADKYYAAGGLCQASLDHCYWTCETHSLSSRKSGPLL